MYLFGAGDYNFYGANPRVLRPHEIIDFENPPKIDTWSIENQWIHSYLPLGTDTCTADNYW